MRNKRGMATAFEAPDATDLRGKPAWEPDRWKDRA